MDSNPDTVGSETFWPGRIRKIQTGSGSGPRSETETDLFDIKISISFVNLHLKVVKFVPTLSRQLAANDSATINQRRSYKTVDMFRSRVEVSGHNLESSQTWGFCIDFLNHSERWKVLYQVFLHSPLQSTGNWPLETVRGCVSLKKEKSQSKAVEVTVNSKEENS